MIEELTTIFSPEELFDQTIKGRTKHETVKPNYRRAYSMSPLEYQLRKEEHADLLRKKKLLLNIFRQELSFEEYGFLAPLINDALLNGQRMLPLEFKELTDHEFTEYVMNHLDEMQERIHVIKDNCEGATLTNRMGAIQNFIRIPYSCATKKKIINTYELVKQGTLQRYPNGYFHPDNKRVPKILTRYLVEDILQLPQDKTAIEKLTQEDFQKNKLGWMLELYFAGNIRNALKHAYSPKDFPDLYDSKPDSEDVLRQVFKKLNSKAP